MLRLSWTLVNICAGAELVYNVQPFYLPVQCIVHLIFLR